ncbi:ATP-dependent Clp protease adaptor ClpS [Tautonia rosea]|uniref:ATP-dependent Clp protease adaptor ClpS n=1 Tax=Tautonia rosea TaxID=2728037 RepID=UPI00147274FA|nr:ATP-dependent Clp protease adaptor ClpS [Tautonia rosea]
MSEFDHEHSGDTSVADPIVTTKTAPKPQEHAENETETRRQPPYNVIILNDEEHTFDYVIELLCKLFRHSLATAQELTWRIHLTGRAVVLTTHKELAELKRDQVLSYGPDPRMSVSKGPLDCFIEPAPGG